MTHKKYTDCTHAIKEREREIERERDLLVPSGDMGPGVKL